MTGWSNFFGLAALLLVFHGGRLGVSGFLVPSRQSPLQQRIGSNGRARPTIPGSPFDQLISTDSDDLCQTALCAKLVRKYKLKTNRAAAKRFKITGAGRILRKHSHFRHLLRKKTPRTKQKLAKTVTIDLSTGRNNPHFHFKQLLPYERFKVKKNMPMRRRRWHWSGVKHRLPQDEALLAKLEAKKRPTPWEAILSESDRESITVGYIDEARTSFVDDLTRWGAILQGMEGPEEEEAGEPDPEPLEPVLAA